MGYQRSAVQRSGTIAAAGSNTEDFDIKWSQHIAVVISNTGSNAITGVQVWKSPIGTLFGQDVAASAAIGTIAAGASVLVEVTESCSTTFRLILSSTTGTTYSIELGGK